MHPLLLVDQPAFTIELLLVSGVIRLWAVAATSEQFGEIVHLAEIDSLERMISVTSFVYRLLRCGHAGQNSASVFRINLAYRLVSPRTRSGCIDYGLLTEMVLPKPPISSRTSE